MHLNDRDSHLSERAAGEAHPTGYQRVRLGPRESLSGLFSLWSLCPLWPCMNRHCVLCAISLWEGYNQMAQ